MEATGKQMFRAALLGAAVFLMACEGPLIGPRDKTRDYGLDAKPLSQLKAGVWIDPNGCDHWIIDDGLEGYMTPRLDRNGKPVCSGPGLSNSVIGKYQSGSPFGGKL